MGRGKGTVQLEKNADCSCDTTHKTPNTDIKFVTLNVRGMHTATKLYSVYAYVKRQQTQVALLQENERVITGRTAI